jgi:hypothetical protein
VNRSLTFQCFNATTALAPGEVLVASGFSHPERGPVRCSAASALAAWLRRRGQNARLEPVAGLSASAPAARPDNGTVLFVVTYLDQQGRAVGLGAAAAIGCDPVDAAFGAVRTWGAAFRTRSVMLAAVDPSCPGERSSLASVRAKLASSCASAAGAVLIPVLRQIGCRRLPSSIAAELLLSQRAICPHRYSSGRSCLCARDPRMDRDDPHKHRRDLETRTQPGAGRSRRLDVSAGTGRAL